MNLHSHLWAVVPGFADFTMDGGAGNAVLEALMQQLAGTSRAAVNAAAAATAAVEASRTSSTSGANQDWSELLPRPEIFQHTSAEQEISDFHDWPWNFETYLLSLDSMYKEDMARIQQSVARPIDAAGLTTAEKTRSTRLYALLVEFTRNRAASLIRAVVVVSVEEK